MNISLSTNTNCGQSSRIGVYLILFLCFLVFVSVVIYTSRREAWLIAYNTIYLIPLFIASIGTFIVLIELKIRNISQHKTNDFIITFIILLFLSFLALPSIKWLIWLSVNKPNLEAIEITNKEVIEHGARATEYIVSLESPNILGNIQVSKTLFYSLEIGQARQIMYKDAAFGIVLNLNKT